MIKKEYLKDGKTCNVTFTFAAGVDPTTKSVALVGDFNNWDETSTPMKRQKNGRFRVKVKLECGKSYQFRYLMDHAIWENDEQADLYLRTPFGDCDNSVIELSADAGS